jgi:hypothetical protein
MCRLLAKVAQSLLQTPMLLQVRNPAETAIYIVGVEGYLVYGTRWDTCKQQQQQHPG